VRACLYDIDVSLLLHAALPGANSQNPARYSTRDLVNSPFHTHAHAHILFPAARPARATTRLFHTHAHTRTHIVPGSAACKSNDTSIPHTRTHTHTYCSRQRGLQERRHIYSTHTHTCCSRQRSVQERSHVYSTHTHTHTHTYCTRQRSVQERRHVHLPHIRLAEHFHGNPLRMRAILKCCQQITASLHAPL